MPADDDPIHVFNAMGSSRVAGDVVLVRAPTWRDAQSEIPDENYDEDEVEVQDDGTIEGICLDRDGDYPSLEYRGTWMEAGQQVETAAREGENLTLTSIPHNNDRLKEIVEQLKRTYQEAERPGGTP